MATLIEKIVEPVIEDPVIDIFADLPGNGSTVASHVPALNLGPVGRHGRPHPSGAGVLAEEKLPLGSMKASVPPIPGVTPGRTI